MLTAEAFKVANSTAYSRGTGRLRSLRDVVMRLGLESLRNLVLEVGMNIRVFRSPTYKEPMERLQRHMVAVARLSRVICKYTALDCDFAYMCGLLHDLGLAACSPRPRGGEQARPPLAPRRDLARAGDHPRGGGRHHRARLGLPEEVIYITGRHHDLRPQGGRVHPVSAAVYLADMWVVPMGFDALTPQQRQARGHYCRHQNKAGMQMAMDLIGLTPKAITLIRDEARHALAPETPAAS